ncbi:polysaccharide biosynthesis C-terminal domain-containing protein [Actinomycetospora corticicola]|uniref:O-antigen/teichoic acid export membrane protein n=1 Tax=Actinomycetospora corticicola TaxID=663602 RepID=A0A7Y9DSC0_9PSEU|nr:polysaccharide biosynthesis C-terminal domain-containing protein [Actinomycetospora corticicola]NYD34549.1 O-antigen/teichoic acid export membrane protein [Actinomycetospora corticicola]
MARLLPVGEFGELNTVLGVGVVIAGAGDFGVSTLLAKARARHENSLVMGCIVFNRASSLFIATAFAGTLVIIEGFSFAGFAFAFLAVALAIDKNVDCLLSIPIADGDRSTAPISIALRRTATLIAFLTFLALETPALWSYSLSYLLGSLFGQVHIQMFLRDKLSPICEKVKLIATTRSAFPYFVSNFTGQIRLLDTPLVSSVAGVVQAGLYSGATKIVQPFSLIPGVVTTVIMPHSARLSPDRARVLSRKLVALAILFLALMAIPTIFSADIISLILGEQFQAASAALGWTLLGLAFVSLSSPLGSVLQSQGHERLVAKNGFFFAIANLVGVLLGSWASGAQGAAAAIALVFFIKSTTLVYFIENRVRGDILKVTG